MNYKDLFIQTLKHNSVNIQATYDNFHGKKRISVHQLPLLDIFVLALASYE